MANQTLASLAITMRANAAELVQEVRAARQSLAGLGEMMKGLAGAATGAAAAMGTIAVAQANAIRETKLWADQLGISTQRLTELSAAFQQSANIDGEQFNDMLQELNNRLGEAAVTGGGALAEAFEVIGLKVDDVRKLKTDEMILTIADAFKVLDDQQALTFASAEIFAGEGEKIVEILKQGRGPIEDMAKGFRDLNGTISDKQAQDAADFANSIKKLETAFGSLSKELAIFVSGPGAGAAEWLAETLKNIRQADDVLRKNKISETINELNDELAKNATIVEKFDGRAAPGHYYTKMAENAKKRIEEIKVQLGDLMEESQGLLPGVTTADKNAAEEAKKIAEEAMQAKIKNEQDLAEAKKKLEEEEESRRIAAAEKRAAMVQEFGGDPESMFERMQEQHMTELELLNANFEDKKALFEKFKEFEIGTEKERNKLMLDEHFKYFNQRRKLELAEGNKNISDKKRFMDHVLKNSKAGGKIMLAQQKAQALAEALIEAKKSVISAYRWGNSIGGPVVGAAFAATAAAVSASMIADIVNPGGGSSASTGGGGGAPSVPDVTTPGLEEVSAANDEPQTTKTITVAFEGEGELVPRSVLRELAEELNSLDDSNVRISI